MMVSVFGGSQPEENSQQYAQARELGKLLAEHSHTVLTGGYIGTMEAVSRGAADSGGRVIGVTCAEIERWRAIGVNRWVTEEWKKATLIERLQSLVEGCDAALALPGGPGTLTEISIMWNLMIVKSLRPKPLILIGDGWKSVFEQLFGKLGEYVSPGQRQFLQFTPDIFGALQLLEATT